VFFFFFNFQECEFMHERPDMFPTDVSNVTKHAKEKLKKKLEFSKIPASKLR